MDNGKSKKNKKFLIIIIFTVLLVILNGVLIYVMMQNKKEINQKTEIIGQKEDEISSTALKIDSLTQQLDIRIAEAKKLNKDYEELLEIKEQLLNDKQNLSKKNDDGTALANVEKYKERIKKYEELLLQKDEELDKWQGIAGELTTEVVQVKQQKNVLIDSISSVQKEKQQLEKVVAQASILKTENIKIDAISKRGKIKNGGEYKNKHIDKLKIAIRLADNKAANIETKTVYMRLVEPSGAVLVGQRGGSFANVDGKNLNYSDTQQILFDNSRQTLSFNFSKGSIYRKGKHKIEVYCEGYLIGTGDFNVR